MLRQGIGSNLVDAEARARTTISWSSRTGMKPQSAMKEEPTSSVEILTIV